MKLDSSCAAVITGGASGLGAATARALASEGVKVALFDLNAEAGEKLAREIGGVSCAVDVADEASVIAAFARAREAHGQERILVNCAGIGGSLRTVARDRESGETRIYPLERFRKIVTVNMIGTFCCASRAAAGMMDLPPDAQGERGVIVNTASVAAYEGQIGQIAYTASKAGIVGMTITLARDLSREGIRVNTIVPGVFNTPLMNAAPQEVKAALAASVPFPPRMGEPDEYASLALEMMRNRYFNGESVRLDGAIRMGPR